MQLLTNQNYCACTAWRWSEWTNLGSQPLHCLFGIQVKFGHTDGLLISRKVCIREQHSGFQTLLQ